MPSLKPEFSTQAAVDLIGLPYKPLGHDPELGLDCGGVLFETCRRCGIEPFIPKYSQIPVRGEILQFLRKTGFTECHINQAQVLTFTTLANRLIPTHMGVYHASGLIHAFTPDGRNGRVLHETPIPRRWREALTGAWRF